MTANVVGLDLALRHAGAARLTLGGRLETWRHTTHPIDDATPAELALRIRAVKRWAFARATTATQLVVIEDLPPGTKLGHHDERAAVILGTVELFTAAGIPVALIHPTTMKAKIAHGRASKSEIRDAVHRLYPRQGLGHASDDETDAAALAILGAARLAAVHGPPWQGPWLAAHQLRLIGPGFRWPRELAARPEDQPKPPLPLFQVPHR